jgi:hypothetical protein
LWVSPILSTIRNNCGFSCLNRFLESTQNYCIFLLAILKLSYSESRTLKTIQLRTAGNNFHRLFTDCTRQVRRSIPLPSMWHLFFLNSAFDKTLHERYRGTFSRSKTAFRIRSRLKIRIGYAKTNACDYGPETTKKKDGGSRCHTKGDR